MMFCAKNAQNAPPCDRHCEPCSEAEWRGNLIPTSSTNGSVTGSRSCPDARFHRKWLKNTRVIPGSQPRLVGGRLPRLRFATARNDVFRSRVSHFGNIPPTKACGTQTVVSLCCRSVCHRPRRLGFRVLKRYCFL